MYLLKDKEYIIGIGFIPLYHYRLIVYNVDMDKYNHQHLHKLVQNF